MRGIFSALFLMAGYNKLLNGSGEEPMMLAIYDQLGSDIMLAASLAEIGGGLGLLIPAVSAYSNILLMLLMIIAIIMAIIVGGLSAAIFPAGVLIGLGRLLYLQRNRLKYLEINNTAV